MAMCSRLLRKVPLFQNRDENFIHAVLLKLEYEVFLEGDVIIRRSAPGDRMFFIDHGQALMETELEERELCDGDFFGGGFYFHGIIVHLDHQQSYRNHSLLLKS